MIIPSGNLKGTVEIQEKPTLCNYYLQKFGFTGTLQYIGKQTPKSIITLNGTIIGNDLSF